ncbi:MAG: 50S ribosomal protein L11 [Candidatus Altiarchaeales archaeon]|nr:50S ribosomal protein L11 [Candidatus Altiarchaeales archaeon]MBD3416698.1 50S ribosomal protein L11 [Candidatus Altiarchaeales archaeon]
MTKKETVKILVDGGAATAGPPLGPALGPMGVNAQKVVEEINKATESFKGMKVPVEVIVDPSTKEFEVKIGSPPTSALLLKALGAEKGSGSKDATGDLSFDQVLEVAKGKQGSILANSLKGAVLEIVGTCQSLNITINGLTPKEMTAALKEGKLDDYISGKTDKLPALTHHEEEKVKIVGMEERKPEEKPAEEEGETKEGETPEEGKEKDDKAPEKGEKKG